jgi:GAF domain-containing protein
VPDLTKVAERWPRWVAEARSRSGFASVHALPMRLRGQVLGTLNLLHSVPGSLPAEDLALGQALTDIATIGIVHERAIRHREVVNQQLQTALTSRVVIEQAKGVLAQYGGLGMDAAFNRLRDYVRSHHLRLSMVVQSLVQGELDPALITPQVDGPRPRRRR